MGTGYKYKWYNSQARVVQFMGKSGMYEWYKSTTWARREYSPNGAAREKIPYPRPRKERRARNAPGRRGSREEENERNMFLMLQLRVVDHSIHNSQELPVIQPER
jgi:hypothetical protein